MAEPIISLDAARWSCAAPVNSGTAHELPNARPSEAPSSLPHDHQRSILATVASKCAPALVSNYSGAPHCMPELRRLCRIYHRKFTLSGGSVCHRFCVHPRCDSLSASRSLLQCGSRRTLFHRPPFSSICVAYAAKGGAGSRGFSKLNLAPAKMAKAFLLRNALSPFHLRGRATPDFADRRR